MHIQTFIVSPFATNCYLVGCPDTHEAAVIDPGDDGPAVAEAARSGGWNVGRILLTHGHTDHVAGAGRLKEETGADILIHPQDEPLLAEAVRMALAFGWSVDEVPPADGRLEEGDEVAVGSLSFGVLHTPGHSPGGVCFTAPGVAFVGDTLFAGSIGRTDLPGGSHEQLLRMIREKILVLPGETQVLTGHGPATTVAREKASNPFLTGRGGLLF